MILNGCPNTGSLYTPYRTSNPKSHSSVSAGIPCRPSKVVFSCSGCSWAPHLISCSFKGTQLQFFSSASSLNFSGELGSLSHTIPKITLPRQLARASKDVPHIFHNYRYPAMKEKPQWWWRTLACLPYLMPLHETWMYAVNACHLNLILEDFEYLAFPFLREIGRLPSWFFMAYTYAAYLGVVRRKEWPHYFRFHVVMGMLLDTALQVMWTVNRWMPLAVYKGKIGMYFWIGVSFTYLFTVLDCMRSALAGRYADIPFVANAACMHTS